MCVWREEHSVWSSSLRMRFFSSRRVFFFWFEAGNTSHCWGGEWRREDARRRCRVAWQKSFVRGPKALNWFSSNELPAAEKKAFSSSRSLEELRRLSIQGGWLHHHHHHKSWEGKKSNREPGGHGIGMGPPPLKVNEQNRMNSVVSCWIDCYGLILNTLTYAII